MQKSSPSPEHDASLDASLLLSGLLVTLRARRCLFRALSPHSHKILTIGQQ